MVGWCLRGVRLVRELLAELPLIHLVSSGVGVPLDPVKFGHSLTRVRVACLMMMSNSTDAATDAMRVFMFMVIWVA